MHIDPEMPAPPALLDLGVVFPAFRLSINSCVFDTVDLIETDNFETNREGVNREKLTVKKIINNEIFFVHRLRPL